MKVKKKYIPILVLSIIITFAVAFVVYVEKNDLDYRDFIPGCADFYKGKRPYDYGPAKWISEEPYIWFEVPEEYEADKENLLGTMIYKGEEINISVRFQTFGGKNIFVYNLDNNSEQLARGACKFEPEKLVVEFKDNVFDSDTKTVTFIREATAE